MDGYYRLHNPILVPYRPRSLSREYSRPIAVSTATSQPVHVGGQVDCRSELLSRAGVHARARVIVAYAELATLPGDEERLRCHGVGG
jgi:hypothetical protein